MTIYLISDAVNDTPQIADPITISSLGTQPWTFRYKGIVNTVTATTAFAGTSSSSTVAGPAVGTAGQMIIRSSANVAIATSPNGFVIFGEDHKYECEHLANGAISWKRDDIEIGTGNYTGTQQWTNINQFFRATSAAAARLGGKHEYIEFVGTVNANKWDSNLSGGTGNFWPTANGLNQATLVNFPTDGTQWENTGGADTALQAAGQAIAAGVAALITAIMLAGAGAAAATGTANMTTVIPLQATGSAVASGTANLTTGSASLSASGQAIASGSAQLNTEVRLLATGSTAGSGTASLSTQIRLQASGAAAPSGTANLTAGNTGLSASGQALASGNAQLTTSINLTALGAALPAGTAILTTGTGLQAFGHAMPAGSAALATEIRLAASGRANPSGSATLGNVDMSYQPDPDRLTYIPKETRISAVFGENRITIVDRDSRIHTIRGNA